MERELVRIRGNKQWILSEGDGKITMRSLNSSLFKCRKRRVVRSLSFSNQAILIFRLFFASSFLLQKIWSHSSHCRAQMIKLPRHGGATDLTMVSNGWPTRLLGLKKKQRQKWKEKKILMWINWVVTLVRLSQRGGTDFFFLEVGIVKIKKI